MQPVDPYVSQAQTYDAETAQMRRSDPAPSRLSYRIERLKLTPLFGFSTRVLLPAVVISAVLGGWYAKEDNRQKVSDLIAGAVDAIQNRPEFQVHMMSIDGASPELADEIRIQVPLHFPLSSFDLDLDGMRENLNQLPSVETATLRVRSGGVLQVDIVERVPAVLLRDEGRLILMDKTGEPVRAALAVRTSLIYR